jgi:hypothetical protein
MKMMVGSTIVNPKRLYGPIVMFCIGVNIWSFSYWKNLHSALRQCSIMERPLVALIYMSSPLGITLVTFGPLPAATYVHSPPLSSPPNPIISLIMLMQNFGLGTVLSHPLILRSTFPSWIVTIYLMALGYTVMSSFLINILTLHSTCIASILIFGMII